MRPWGAAAAGFAVVMGGALAGGGVKLADALNQVLTLVLLGLFTVLTVGGAARADWSHADWAGSWDAAPATVGRCSFTPGTPWFS